MNNGKWSKKCQVSNCKKPYIFNTYTKECEISYIYNIEKKIEKEKEQLKGSKGTSNIKIILIIIFIFIAFILYIRCKNRKNRNSDIESVIIQQTITQ